MLSTPLLVFLNVPVIGTVLPLTAPTVCVNPPGNAPLFQLNVLATPLLICNCGSTLMPVLLHTEATVVFTPTGSAFTGTVIVNEGPVHPALVGVTVYTAFNTPPVKFRNVSVMTPDPVPPPPTTCVNPVGKLRTHANVLVNPLVMLLCGSNVKLTFEHCATGTLLLP
jgi:hypothetical protein